MLIDLENWYIYFFSVPPLSLAMHQPELPDGEVEPEFLILGNREPVGTDGRFIHIMVN